MKKQNEIRGNYEFTTCNPVMVTRFDAEGNIVDRKMFKSKRVAVEYYEPEIKKGYIRSLTDGGKIQIEELGEMVMFA